MSAFDIASLPPTGPSTAPPSASGTNVPAVKIDGARIDGGKIEDDAKKDAAAQDDRGFFDRMWGKEGFSFGALIDIINPLQHIPVVGTIYRAVTGDSIGPAARIAGGALFGGMIGLVTSSIDAAIQETTGEDIGQHILALRSDADEPSYPDSRPDPNGPRLAGDFSPDVLDRKYAQANTTTDKVAQIELPPVIVTADNATAAPQAAPSPAAATTIATATAGAAPAANAPRGLPISARPHEVANGAGGTTIPLNSTVPRSGRGAIELPTPQSLAADPAMLRQMQTARAPANQPRNVSSIDTTIRPNGKAGAAASFLDYTPKNAALINASELDGDAADTSQSPGAAQSPGVSQNPGMSQNKARETAVAQHIDAASLPQVPADLITRMNMALEKYQTMQRAGSGPAINVTQ